MATNATNDPNSHSDVPAPTGNDGENEQSDTQKSFSQEEVNAIVSKRISEEKTKSDKSRQSAIDEAVKNAIAEYERKSKLSEDERTKEELSKRNAEIEEREQAITLRERRAEAVEALAKKDIPAELVDYVVDIDEDKTSKNIDNLEEAWKKALDEKVAERLKLGGKTPKDLSHPTTTSGGTASRSGVYSKNGVSAF